MKLAHKLSIGLVLGILAVMGGLALWERQNEVVLFQSDVSPRERRGAFLLRTLRNVWETEGEARARMLVDEVASTIDWMSVRWLQVDSPEIQELPAEARETIEGGEVYRIVVVDDAGTPARFYFVKLGPDAPVVLEIRESLEREMIFVRHSRRATIVATAAVTGVCALIALVLGFRLVGEPVRMLRDRAQRIGDGDLSTRLGLRQRDEIGDLARAIDAMCDRLEDANRRLAEETQARVVALEQLRHSDRLATVGQMAAGVAHELGSPLSVVTARAELLASGELAGSEVVENARVISEQGARITAIIRQLLDFSRRRGAQLAVADLRPIVLRTLDLLGTTARRHCVDVEVAAGATSLLVRVDQAQIQQAVTNVVVNGIQAMTAGGRLTVRLCERTASPPAGFDGPPGPHACIEVEDRGPGIPPDQLGRIFEPFFTTKPVGEGTGLGLSVAYGIVAEHGGWFEVESAVGTGTVFRIFLPLAAAAGVEAAAS